MRILYITNDLPWPLTRGYLRHYHMIRELSASHAITLLTLVQRGHGTDDAAALSAFTEQVVGVASTSGRTGLATRIGVRVGGLTVGGDRAALELGRLGTQLHATTPFDAMLLSGKRTYPVLSALPPIPLVTDLCDATSSRIRRETQLARPSRRLPLAVSYLETRLVERALIGRSDHVLFATTRDRDALMEPGERWKAAIVPNGVDLDFWRRTSPALGVDRMVLTGAMDYPPNVDAAVQLASVILPLVRRVIPTATVAIVGRDPAPAVQALALSPGVVVTGSVDDVRPYLESASVFAAPIRFGAGIQNKVLEAMAMEVPVVASPLAAEGLRTEDGSRPPIEVARDPGAAAERLIDALRAAAAGRAPVSQLRAYVAEHFDWGRSATRLAGLLEDAADQHADGPVRSTRGRR